MENRVLLSGQVQSSKVFETHTEVQLMVNVSPDQVLNYMGPQVITVHIPDTVMLPNEISPNTFLRVHGLLESNRRTWTLTEFIQRTAPGLETRIEWGEINPDELQNHYSYSHIRALHIIRRSSNEAINTAAIEGRVVSRPRPFADGRMHLRLYNYPDEPIGWYPDTGHQQTVYATISVDRAIQIELQKHIRITDGRVYTYTESESLAYFIRRCGVNLIWPKGFDPVKAKLFINHLAIGASKVYEVELPFVRGSQSEDPDLDPDASLIYVPPSELAQYYAEMTDGNGHVDADDLPPLA